MTSRSPRTKKIVNRAAEQPRKLLQLREGRLILAGLPHRHGNPAHPNPLGQFLPAPSLGVPASLDVPRKHATVVTSTYAHGQANFTRIKNSLQMSAITLTSMTKGKTPKSSRSSGGSSWAVDDKWREDVRAELERRGWSQKEFASMIGVTHPTVSHLIGESASSGSSEHVPKIHELFGWAPPEPARRLRDIEVRMRMLADALPEDELRRLLEVGEMLVRKTRGA